MYKRVVRLYGHCVRVPEHAGTRWNTGTRMVLFLSLFAAVLPPWWCALTGGSRRGAAAIFG